MFLADKGNIALIAGTGAKVGSLTIGSARWDDIVHNGDVVFVADTGTAQSGMPEVTEDTLEALILGGNDVSGLGQITWVSVTTASLSSRPLGMASRALSWSRRRLPQRLAGKGLMA